jgi:hypothetical protein
MQLLFWLHSARERQRLNRRSDRAGHLCLDRRLPGLEMIRPYRQPVELDPKRAYPKGKI